MLSKQQLFATELIRFSDRVVYEIIRNIVTKKKTLETNIFHSEHAPLVCKVILRKYMLSYWEFSMNDNKTSNTVTYLKKTGDFIHDQCLFDFMFIVIYEQMLYICRMMKNNDTNVEQMLQQKRGRTGNESIDEISVPILTRLKPALVNALLTSRHGCLTDCQKK